MGRDLPTSVTLLLTVLTAACVLIIFDFAQAWFDKRNKYIIRIAELENDLRPKITLVASSNVHPKDVPRGVRTVKIEITNISKSTIKNCRVREAKFVNRYGQESGMRRHFRLNEETYADMAKHTYRQNFDLQGSGSTEIVDIAQLDETQDESRVLMLYATSPTAGTLNAIVRDCFPHRLTISVTADNLPVSVEQSYDLKISKGTLQIERVE